MGPAFLYEKTRQLSYNLQRYKIPAGFQNVLFKR